MKKLMGKLLCLGLLLLPFSIGRKMEEHSDIEKKSLNRISVVSDYSEDFLAELKNRYSYYDYSAGIRNYILADALDFSVANGKTLKVRLIDYVTEVDGVPLDVVDLLHKSCIEIVELEQSVVNVFYYPISIDDYLSFAATTQQIPKNSDISSRLNTSFDILSSLSSDSENIKEINIQTRPKYIRNNTNPALVNEQAPLDYYLDTKGIHEGYRTDSFAYTNESIDQCLHYNIDSAIATLLPKSYFTTEGDHQGVGSEWGFYIKTQPELGVDNCLISHVLIYDIIQIRSCGTIPDLVTVKVVEHSNYKYYGPDDIVFNYGENNYCLGNPSLTSEIAYVSSEDDLNAVNHPNPWDSNYQSSLDRGYAFGTYSFQHIGRAKASDNRVTVKEISCITNAVASFTTSIAASILNMNPFVGAAVGTAVSMGVDATFNALTPNVYEYTNDNERYSFDKSTGLYSVNGSKLFTNENFLSAAQHNNLFKKTFMRMPPYNSNDLNLQNANVPNDVQTPLLFKDNDCSINYFHNVISSELADDYTGLVSHNLKLDIFNDNSVFLWKWDPTLLSSESVSWCYSIGKNVRPVTKTINSNTSVKCFYGKNYDQEILFTPTISSAYDICLTNATPNSKIDVTGFTTNVAEYKKNFTSVFKTVHQGVDSLYSTSYQNTYKVFLNLTAGVTYRIKLSRIEDGVREFGTGLLTIYEAKAGLGTLQNNTISGTDLNHISRIINYNGRSQTHYLYNTADTVITVSLTSANESNVDTYLTVLDNFYRPVMYNDDGFGNTNAGLVMRVKAYRPIFIVPRLYSSNSSGSFNLNIYEGEFIPKIQNNQGQQVGRIPIDCSYTHTSYLLISFNDSFTLRIDDLYDNQYATIAIRDANFAIISNTSSNSYVTASVIAHRLYLIELNIHHTYSSSYGLKVYLED